MGARFGKTLCMRRCLCPTWFVLASLIAMTGCARQAEPISIADTPSERAVRIRAADMGPVAVVLTPHPLALIPGGVRRALSDASEGTPCTAAAFFYTEQRRAEQWILDLCAKRRKAGEQPRVILAGHSLGATAASEAAKRILRRTDDVCIELLVTVDAIKTSTLGTTTGMGATVLTLANPIPGKHAYFIAYEDTPDVDGQRVRAHVNYYHLETKLYHGGPIRTATENHRICGEPERVLNHGNIDDYAYPLIRADFERALQTGAAP